MMQQGGPPYGELPPQQQQQPRQQSEMPPFHLGRGAAEAAPPISTRAPPPPPSGGGAAGAATAPNYEELGVGDDPLGVPGDEGGPGGPSGNRWPRQETLALLKIRSDMDATFRDATLKGPLWEDVSRKLGELGYRRSAKKCKEKFENVHKYYKRTKEGRAGRQDGKSYRFFSQLEALHNTVTTSSSTALLSPAHQPMAATPTSFTTQGCQNRNQPDAVAPEVVARSMVQPPMQISAPTPITTAPPPPQLQENPMIMLSENPNAPGSAAAAAAAAATGIGFLSNTSSSYGSESESDDDEATEEGPCSGRKRKRECGGGGSKKMMAFFEGLMRQVMERQESMQQRFLEAIEKREQDRVIREEAWWRQEMSRVAREQEVAVEERAAAAARDAAIISFLQKVTGQTVQLPQPPSVGVASAPTTTMIQTPAINPPPQSQNIQPPAQPPLPPVQQQQKQSTETVRHHQPIIPPTLSAQPPTSSEMVPVGSSEAQEGAMVMSVSLDPASSRWPKSEVHDLIKLRSDLDSRYQESGPKGPLWEEISSRMQRLGYSRSAKRCKEKWENINKYFKKVKESNKKRPEDAKTCPYFHQLDALYRNKHSNSGGRTGGGGGSVPALSHQNSNLNPNPSPITMVAPLPQVQQHQGDQMGSNNRNGRTADQNSGGSSNGGIGSSFFGEGTAAAGGDHGAIMKKPEDIMKELMGQSTHSDYGNLNEPESDNMDEDDEEEDDDDDDDDGKGQYRIQFQNAGNNNAGNGASPNTGGKASSSFLAMVR